MWSVRLQPERTADDKRAGVEDCAIDVSALASDRCDDAKLGKMGTDCVDHRGLLTRECHESRCC